MKSRVFRLMLWLQRPRDLIQRLLDAIQLGQGGLVPLMPGFGRLKEFGQPVAQGLAALAS